MRKMNPQNDGLFPAPWLGKLLLVSLFVMLNLPAILTATTGMDQYGFFTLERVSSRPWPLVLSFLVSTAAAATGFAMYRLLRRKQDWFASNRYGAFQRNALLFGVPVGMAYAPTFFLTGYNDKPAALALAGILSTCLCITAALNDRDIHLDPPMARILFVACIAFILVFLVLCVAAMLVMYLVEQAPSTGNFFWSWGFAWSDLGYPAEEFGQRHRTGLLAFILAASCYMTVAIGGSLLGAILEWAKTGPKGNTGHGERHSQPQNPPVLLPELLKDEQGPMSDLLEFVAVVNGEEIAITRAQYQTMLADKERLLPGARLLVDKASGTAFARTSGRWRKLTFRGRRKGPFLLLCVYARHPGRRFTTSELEMLLKAELPDREGFNVSDFFAQLQKRIPLVPVQRDDHGTFIPQSASVCFLDHWPTPDPEEDAEDHPGQDSIDENTAW